MTIDLGQRAFSIWGDGWTVTPGCYPARVGGSSADLPLSSLLRRGGSDCS